MNTVSNTRANYIRTTIFGLSAIILAASIVTYPDAAFDASLKGLKIWWEIIFPALLPFFITSEILLGFGVVHFMGVLLEPLMKPLFNVPGVGAFVLAMGFASGYPMGAKLTTRLREQNLLTKSEGERLVSFTSTSDPLFLFGAIAVGFFHDAKLGVAFALIHYLSSIIVGLVMKYHKKKESSIPKENNKYQENILKRAFKAMNEARLNENRKFGKLMGDAVMSSIETLLMIGGFIMFFSVILAILTKIQVSILLSKLVTLLLIPLGISSNLSEAVIYGLFEVTLGAKYVSLASGSIPLIEKIAMVSAISAWSGISVHAQVAAILQKTDIRYIPFLFARTLHTILAFIIALVIWNPLQLNQGIRTLSVFMYQVNTSNVTYNIWDTIIYLGYSFSFLLIMMTILSLVMHLVKGSKKYR